MEGPVMHTNFLLKRKITEKGRVSKQKARLLTRWNEDIDIQEDSFSSVANYFVIKLILIFSIPQRWSLRHLDFEKPFPNGHLEGPVLAELPKKSFSRLTNEGYVIKFKKRLYGLKGVAKVWNKLLPEVLNPVEFCKNRENTLSIR